MVTAGSAKIDMADVSDSIAANVVLKGGVAKKIVISNDDYVVNCNDIYHGTCIVFISDVERKELC